jgi:hypothetical protein
MRRILVVLFLALVATATLAIVSTAVPNCELCASSCSGTIYTYTWEQTDICNGCGALDLHCRNYCGVYYDGLEECLQAVYEANHCGTYC